MPFEGLQQGVMRPIPQPYRVVILIVAGIAIIAIDLGTERCRDSLAVRAEGDVRDLFTYTIQLNLNFSSLDIKNRYDILEITAARRRIPAICRDPLII